MRNAPTAMATALLLTVLACQPEPPDAEDAPAAGSVTAVAQRPEHAPLLAIMRWLEQDMLALSSALWRDSLAVVAERAAAIAEHPTVPDTIRQAIVATLGEEAAGFRQSDMLVHNTAVALADAARAGRMEAVLAALDTLQHGCVACHEQFRDRLAGISR